MMTAKTPATAFLGIGGNVGDVLNSMRSLLAMLDESPFTTVVGVSHVYKTPPWGIEDQDWFLNCCAELSTHLSPESLLEECLEIEKLLQRERTVRWGPRTIDADVLYFDGQTIVSETLTIPHPRMHERQFVMEPLADIAPDLIVKGKPVRQWVLELASSPLERLQLRPAWWRQNSTEK